jgi:hypothetical protein
VLGSAMTSESHVPPDDVNEESVTKIPKVNESQILDFVALVRAYVEPMTSGCLLPAPARAGSSGRRGRFNTSRAPLCASRRSCLSLESATLLQRSKSSSTIY